jgi:hypothetical protein
VPLIGNTLAAPATQITIADCAGNTTTVVSGVGTGLWS